MVQRVTGWKYSKLSTIWDNVSRKVGAEEKFLIVVNLIQQFEERNE